MNIVVIGGGTAGWMTALMVKKFYPNHSIKLIESQEIGILGAGEGSTTHFINFLDTVNIPVSELVKNCGATLKLGINFENWNGDKKSYFHAFASKESLNEFKFLFFTHQMSKECNSEKLNFNKKLTKDKKVPFSFRDNSNCLFENNILSFTNHSPFSLHFNARQLASYFSVVAQSRGVERIESKVKNFSCDVNGNINKVILENDSKIDCDFIFDCSGFARLVLGKFFNTDWISYSDHLPLNTALPFFIAHDGNVKPQTDAIAMKCGWVWKIPVENRYGCGYVFDSSYINEEEALIEAEQHFQCKLISPKTFKFKAGTFKKTFVKNCLAIGLSQSFVEPLEATSIWISFLNLNEFLMSDGINSKSEIFKTKFNDKCLKRNQEVVEFLYLHYLTKRNDSKFWQEFRHNHPMIPSIVEKLEILNEFENNSLETGLFEKQSWLQIMSGLNLFDTFLFQEKIKKFNNNFIESHLNSFLKNQDNVIKSCVTHKEFLEYLRQ